MVSYGNIVTFFVFIGTTVVKNSWAFFSQLPPHERRLTSASCITVSRMLLAPISALLVIYGYLAWAIAVFLIAALTDVVDGFVARYFNQKTFLGEWLDALADKILTISSFLALWYVPLPMPFMHWFISMVLVRELLLIIGACVFYQQNGPFSLAPLFLARLSMVLYIMIVFFALVSFWGNYDYQPFMILCMLVTLICSFSALAKRFYQLMAMIFS